MAKIVDSTYFFIKGCQKIQGDPLKVAWAVKDMEY